MEEFSFHDSDDEPLALLRPLKPGNVDTIGLRRADSDSDSDWSNSEDESLQRKRKRPGLIHSSTSQEESRAGGSARKGDNLIPLIGISSATCCDKHCLEDVGMLEVERIRNRFQSLNKHEQTQYIIDYLRDHSKCDGNKFSYKFIIGTTVVCEKGWMAVTGIKRARFYNLRKEVQEGRVCTSVAGKARLGSKLRRTQETLEWLESFAANYGDKMPDSEKVQLPSCMTKKQIYLMCKESFESQGLEPPSRSHFYNLWARHHKNITIHRNYAFGKCNKCTLISTNLAKTTDKKQRAKLIKIREKHLSRQNRERQKYYKHCRKARLHPDKYMSIIIDGMDQAKTNIPHFYQPSKQVSGMWKLRTHLTGAIVHGQGVYGYFDSCEWPHSSNLTITVLLNIIYMYRNNLPEVLYLQMDNCGRENKNRFVFAFCALLVELGIFRKVKVSFLMVGHTHEDVDQLFSRYSTYLRKHDAITIDSLVSSFEKCFTPSPTGIVLDNIPDVCRWMHPFIEDIAHHSKPHVFCFTKDKEGKARLMTKKWSTDILWKTCSGMASGHLLKSIPTGKPLLVQPDYQREQDLERLQDAVRSSSKYMDQHARDWWNVWFDQIDQLSIDPVSTDDYFWLLPEILSAQRPRECRTNEENISETENLDIDSDISDEDNTIEHVRIGRKEPSAVRVASVNGAQPLKKGDLCLLDVPKWADYWPLLGEVLEIQDVQVEIRWWRSSLRGICKPEQLLSTQGQGRVDWKETVGRSQIWLWGFTLTPGGRFPEPVRRAIEKYENE